MKKKVLVALGASSGGLAVLSEFFDHTLPDAVSYVITMHLHPEHRSLLAEILQKHSDLTVKEVQDRMTIRSNEVYVMPENKVMTIADGRLLLTPRNRAIKINNAIDIFFESLAAQTVFRVIAIVLSGYGTDGTAGVQAIKDSGGTIIAQDLVDQGRKSMPDSVITAGLADFILQTAEMPEAIIRIVHSAT